MCYDAKSATRNAIQYARKIGASPEEIEALERELRYLEAPPYYHVSAFEHPKLIVLTDQAPRKPQLFTWGLIPAWTKDRTFAKTISNQTLNARGETMFEKPAFRSSAKSKRCVVILDAFYEHHHLGKKTYPYHIGLANGEPMAVAGLWDEWVDKETGEIIQTVSIVTTCGNRVMAKIHNNPKLEFGPRMPAILPWDRYDLWLQPIKNDHDKADLLKLLQPVPAEALSCYPVRRLKGKEAIGNVPEAEQPCTYEELADFNCD